MAGVQKAAETGDYRDMLAGNSPIIVDKQTGAVTVTGTAYPVEKYIRDYCNAKAVAIYNADNPDFVNTSEAYSKHIFVGDEIIVVPYVNLGLMPRNPINAKQSVVDFSYYVIKGVRSMSFSGSKGKLLLHSDGSTEAALITEYIMCGREEVTIRCKERWFYLPATSAIRDPFVPFVPRDTPNFKRNMDPGKVEAFFLFDNLPGTIKDLLGNDSYSLSWH